MYKIKEWHNDFRYYTGLIFAAIVNFRHTFFYPNYVIWIVGAMDVIVLPAIYKKLTGKSKEIFFKMAQVIGYSLFIVSFILPWY